MLTPCLLVSITKFVTERLQSVVKRALISNEDTRGRRSARTGQICLQKLGSILTMRHSSGTLFHRDLINEREEHCVFNGLAYIRALDRVEALEAQRNSPSAAILALAFSLPL